MEEHKAKVLAHWNALCNPQRLISHEINHDAHLHLTT